MTMNDLVGKIVKSSNGSLWAYMNLTDDTNGRLFKENDYFLILSCKSKKQMKFSFNQNQKRGDRYDVIVVSIDDFKTYEFSGLVVEHVDVIC